jgi:hypothetical protein
MALPLAPRHHRPARAEGQVRATMQTPRAYHKAAEAGFFLNHLRSEQRVPKHSTPAAFAYYLSAFLSAARSTLWVVEREVKTALKAGAAQKKRAKAAYPEWKARWESDLTATEHSYWELLRDQRDEEIHGLGVETTVEVRMAPLKPSGYGGVYAAAMGGDPPALYAEDWMRWKIEHGFTGWAGAWQGVEVHHFDVAGKRQEVLAACERILGLLQRFLRDLHESSLASPGHKPDAGAESRVE